MLVGESYPKLLLRVGRTRDAVEAADRIASSGEENATTQLWYGQFLQGVASMPTAPEDLRKECQEKSGTALAKAVELGGDSPAPWLAHITNLLASGDLSAAEDAMRQAQLRLEEDQQQLLMARSYEMMGRWFDAENIYRMTYEQNPESEQVARQLATFYLGGRYPRPDGSAKAAKLINDILRQNVDDPDSVRRDDANWARRTAAQMLASTGDYQNLLDAEKLLRSNAINNTLALEDKLLMASILAVRPEPVSRTKAIRLLEEVQSQQRLNPELDLTLGKLYYAMDNWAKCRDHMESLITRYRNSFGPREAYIRMLLDRGGSNDLRVAEGQVKQLIEIAPTNPATLELVSLTYSKLGDDRRAKQSLRRMLPDDLSKLDANGYRLVARVASLLINAGDIDTAENLLGVLVKRPGATAGDQLQFIQFIGMHRDVDRAMKLLEQAADDANLMAVADVAATIVRAKRDEVGDKYDETIVGWFDRAEREDPDSITVFLAKANFRDIQGRYEDAANIYRTVLKNESLRGKPKAAVLNNLAYLLALARPKKNRRTRRWVCYAKLWTSWGRSATSSTLARPFGLVAASTRLRLTTWPWRSPISQRRRSISTRHSPTWDWGRRAMPWPPGNCAENLGLTRESVGRLEEEQYDKLKSQIEGLKGKGQGL